MKNGTASLWIIGLLMLPQTAFAAWRLRARKASHSALAILVVPMLAGVLSSPAHGEGEFTDCGNGQIDTEEVCDSWNVGDKTCALLGYGGGSLGCQADCSGYDVSACGQVSVPNTLNNASVADAPAMNENFDAVLSGLNAALTTGPVSVPNTFSNGTTADADEVNANFTAVVDGVNTALANRATDCAAAGGTWDAGTSTCTAASNYNCFVGGFCAQAAIDYPPAAYGYTNVYDGHTKGADPALGAGCNTSPGEPLWDYGALVVYYLELSFISLSPLSLSPGPCASN